MTARQYLERKDSFGFWSIGVMVFLAGGAIFLEGHYFHQHFLEKTVDNRFFVSALVSTAVIMFGWLLVFKLFHWRFTKNHPEMRFINAWEEFGFSLDTYPTNDVEKVAVANVCLETLTEFALVVNRVALYRSRFSAEQGSLVDAVWQESEVSKQLINSRFALKSKIYIDYWNLVVKGIHADGEGLEIVNIPLLSPEEFCEHVDAQYGDLLG